MMIIFFNPLDLFFQSINSIAPWLGQRSKHTHDYATFLTLNRLMMLMQKKINIEAMTPALTASRGS
jgi:hypothetical protein